MKFQFWKQRNIAISSLQSSPGPGRRAIPWFESSRGFADFSTLMATSTWHVEGWPRIWLRTAEPGFKAAFKLSEKGTRPCVFFLLKGESFENFLMFSWMFISFFCACFLLRLFVSSVFCFRFFCWCWCVKLPPNTLSPHVPKGGETYSQASAVLTSDRFYTEVDFFHVFVVVMFDVFGDYIPKK